MKYLTFLSSSLFLLFLFVPSKLRGKEIYLSIPQFTTVQSDLGFIPVTKCTDTAGNLVGDNVKKLLTQGSWRNSCHTDTAVASLEPNIESGTGPCHLKAECSYYDRRNNKLSWILHHHAVELDKCGKADDLANCKGTLKCLSNGSTC